MKRIVLIVLLTLFTIILKGDIFDRFRVTSRKSSISQADNTLFAFKVIQDRYLNKTKIKPGELLTEALNHLQDEFSEIVADYSPEKREVRVQIYNRTHLIQVERMRDIWDVAVVLRQIYRHIEREYKPESGRELSDVEYVSVNGILKKLDPHSYIFTPREFEDFTSSTEGNFGGLGIVISMNEDGEIVVVSPMDGTPAEKAGVEAGDVIVQINEQSAVNLPLSKAVEKMRGEPGTDVNIYVKRKGVPKLLKFEITRAVIKVKSVVFSMRKNGVGYVKLTGFQENSLTQLKDALAQLKRKGMRALILDMRNNPGGLLSQAIKISDLFLDRGVIVSTVDGMGEKRDESRADSDRDDVLSIPMAVLINEGSASAAEIVTAALKKNSRAVVLGRRSFGKGSVQNLIRIPGGGGLKLTVAQYLTPGDVSIQSVGITPDVELIPSYIDKKKVSLFRSGLGVLKEKDLKEHIESKYIPKQKEKPSLTIRYHKPYKDPEKLIKERRREKVGVFRNDEEIEIAAKLLSLKLQKKKDLMGIATTLKAQEWDKIIAALGSLDVKWDISSGKVKVDPAKLNISLVSSSKLAAGKTNYIRFKAEYPGKIENLSAYLSTDIPFMKNVEILFGSFTGSVERDVPVTLPDYMPWRKEKVTAKVGIGEFTKPLKSIDVEMETDPVAYPEIRFSYLVQEVEGRKNGLMEENEKLKVKVWMKNVGKGTLSDGRLLLTDKNNSKEVFIKKGSSQITMKPGEEREVEFFLDIGKLQEKSGEIKIAAELYDYKTRYSAGFSVPFISKSKGCLFSREPDTKMLLGKDVTLFNAASEGSRAIGEVKREGVVSVTGSCGDFFSTETGYWVKRSDTNKLEKKIAEKIKSASLFPIYMPRIDLDISPIQVDKSTFSLPFKVEGEKIQDVFVFLNNRKVFYYRAGMNGSKSEFTVPLNLTDKTNRITVVVKGADSEKVSAQTRYVIYPEGKSE